MKKRILLLATLAFALFFTFTAYAGTWQQEGSNWKYLKDNGSFAASEWVQDNTKWYYFNEQSIPETETRRPVTLEISVLAATSV